MAKIAQITSPRLLKKKKKKKPPSHSFGSIKNRSHRRRRRLGGGGRSVGPYFSIATEFLGINPTLMSAAIQIEIADILLLLPPSPQLLPCCSEETLLGAHSLWDETRTSRRKLIPHDGTVTTGIDSRTVVILGYTSDLHTRCPGIIWTLLWDVTDLWTNSKSTFFFSFFS